MSKGNMVERITAKQEDGTDCASESLIRVEAGDCSGPLIERLAAYENMHELIERQYTQAAEKLEALKGQGRIKSSQAQQLLAQKLTYSSMLNLIE
ncbi:MAG: hypothetical protein RR672_00745 [Raoultibacter sp.]